MPDINYFAVVAAAISAMVIGALWYGPLFGKAWVRGMGWDPNDQQKMAAMKQSAGPAYLQMFVGVLLTAYVLAHVIWAYSIAAPDITGASAGVQSGLWIWLGFILPVKYGDKLWGGKAFRYVVIDLSFHLATLMVMGVILSMWR